MLRHKRPVYVLAKELNDFMLSIEQYHRVVNTVVVIFFKELFDRSIGQVELLGRVFSDKICYNIRPLVVQDRPIDFAVVLQLEFQVGAVHMLIFEFVPNILSGEVLIETKVKYAAGV